MDRAKLKAPRGQVEREDIKPKHDAPKFAVVDDVAEMLYQVFSAALNHRGPRGVPMKHWHELANIERKAWRYVLEQVLMLARTGDLLMVRKPGPNQITIAMCGEQSWAGRTVDVTILRSITDLRKVLLDIEKQLALQDEEMKAS